MRNLLGVFVVFGLLWAGVVVVGCNEEECAQSQCDQDCRDTGFTSGTCSAGACQCTPSTDGDGDVDADADTDGDGDGDGDAGCQRGTTEPCECEDGGSGTRQCQDGGTWGACSCEATSGCSARCPDVVAAGCSAGPDTVGACVEGCAEILEGGCAEELAKVLSCAQGATYTCDDQNLPVVEGCESDQALLNACLGMGSMIELSGQACGVEISLGPTDLGMIYLTEVGGRFDSISFSDGPLFDPEVPSEWTGYAEDNDIVLWIMFWEPVAFVPGTVTNTFDSFGAARDMGLIHFVEDEGEQVTIRSIDTQSMMIEVDFVMPVSGYIDQYPYPLFFLEDYCESGTITGTMRGLFEVIQL